MKRNITLFFLLSTLLFPARHILAMETVSAGLPSKPAKAIMTDDHVSTLWTGNIAISWNEEYCAGGYFDSYSDYPKMFDDLEQGDTIVFHYTVNSSSYPHIALYYKSEDWNWNELISIGLSESNTVCYYVVADAAIANSIVNRGLAINGQCYTLTSLALHKHISGTCNSNFGSSYSYSIVGGFTNNWSLDDAITFEDVNGLLTANVTELQGMFKIIRNKDVSQWAYQWGCDLNKTSVTAGTPYAMSNTSATGGEPGNLTFGNPFLGYRNAVLTLTEDANCNLLLTLVSGEAFYPSNNWYLAGMVNEWGIRDDYKFTPLNGSDTLVLDVSNMHSEFKIVYGNWIVDLGANSSYDRWSHGMEYVMSYPCVDNMRESGSLVYDQATLTILPDYANASVKLWITCKKNVTISAQHGSVNTTGGLYPIGSQLQLTATPEDGYSFSYWSDFSTENPHTITVSESLDSFEAKCVPIDSVVYLLCLAKEGERSVYFIKPDSWQGDNVHCYMWDEGLSQQMTNSWPGNKATAFTDRLYKFLIPDEFGATTDTWYIIWNNGSSSQQSEDHKYVNNAVFSIENDVTYGHGNITTINYVCTNVCDVVNTEVYDTLCVGRKYYLDNEVKWEPGDYESKRTYISPVGGDSVVVYYLHVADCGDEPIAFDLQFKSSETGSDTGTPYQLDVNSMFTSSTVANASAVVAVSRAYPARIENGVEYGAKLGAGSGGGSMKFVLTTPIVADSILFRVAKYGSDDITYFLFNNTQVGLPTSKNTFETFRLDSVGWIDTITIASVDAGYKRFFIQGMTIYGKTPSKVRTEQATICEGESVTFYGKQYTQDGLYSHSFNVDGTDSVVILRLNVIPTIRVTTDVDTINSMQQYSWRGRTWLYPTWTGYRSFYDTATSAVTDCDSINELQLYVIHQSKPKLTLSLERDTVTESESTTLTIRSAFALPVDETINLSIYSGSSYIESFPKSVVLPAGETDVSVTVITKDNNVISNIRTATLRASGDRFYNTVSIDLRIIDNDTPEISLSLSVNEVQEGSCANCITATVRRLTHPEQDITIRFSDNSGGRISYPSSSLRMNANVTELTATLGVNDNSYCDGTQVIDIVARVNNAYLPCAYDTAQLTITDNDTPILSLRSSTTMLLEGKSEAGVLTVSRNTPTDTALVVNLSVDNPDGLTFPATLTIPAGQSQAQTTVTVERNGVNDDSHQIVFTAACEGFASSDCYVMVIDQTLPDAIISSFSASPTTAEVGSTVNVQITVLNQGAAGLAKGVTTSLYFAGSRVARFALENTLPVGESVTFNTDITMPEKVGTYELYATVNEDKQVKEILHDNNRTYTWYIHTTPSFEVQSLTASKAVCMPGDSVILSGQLSGSRAANAEVEVYSVNNGYRRSFKVQADSNGAFSAVFKPQAGQNGHFAIGACYPSERSTTEMVGIDYYGFEIPVGNLTCMVNTGYDYESRISVRNTGSLTLHNIHAEATNVPEGCHLTFSDISELRGGNYGYIYFTLHSDSSTPGNDWQTVGVYMTTDEGLQGDKTVYYFSRDPRGQLVSSVSSITASVSVQRPMEYVFMLQSTGLGETGEITLSLPDWIQTVTPQTIPSIASGEYAEVILRINTSSFANKLNLPITGDIGISAENCSGMTLPFTITPVSDINGTLHIDVCDENTYYAGGFPHVAGAQVLVKNTSTHQVIAQGLTNAAGIYEIELPEGYYTVSVTADNHDSYTNNILLLPEETTSLTVNLSIRAITVTWTVEETEVEDQYEVVTNVTYETHVPKPVVVVSAPARIAADELAEGESLIYNVTAINQGLIRAEDVTISLPSGGDMFRFEALAYSAPFNMEAKQQVVIPVKVTRLEQPESAPARGPHAMLECQDNMLTLYYWDCGTDRKWHQYATPLIYMDCDDPPTVPTPEPDRDDDPRDPMVIGPDLPYPWPPSQGGNVGCIGCGGTYRDPDEPGTYTDDRGCEPCQNQFLLNVGKLGLDLASLAADFLPQTRLLALAKHTKEFLGAASEAVDCYNNARKAYAEEHTIEAALVGCVTHGEETSWEDMIDELREELSNLSDAIQERMENPNGDDDDDDNSDDIFDDAIDVIDDLIAFTRPCEHTAENAAYAPMRTSEEATDIYAGEPEHLARFKSRVHVALEEIEALENYKKLYINDDIRQYCSNVEIEELMNTWQTMLQASLTDEQLNSVRPAALPDEQWQNLVERMHNTHDAVRGIQPANDNYVSTDSINYYTDKIAACEAQAQAWGYTSSSQMFGKELNLLLGQVDEKSNSVCASISLQFKQTMTLTRQAFRGTLSVFNGHETQAMTNIHLNLEVRSADNGQLATSHEFQIDLENLSDISGEEELVTTDGWTIAANTTGTATILFIPTVYAAPQSDRVWSFGGTLTYTDPFSGLTVTRDLYPVQLTVRPTPLLEMTYFMQRDVYSDDPLTDEIEDSEPAEFALLINNIGYGEAKNVNMTTNAPEIVANEKGLLIEFNMIRSVLNGKQVSLPIGGVTTTQFGTIPAGSQMYAQWFFESTLLGHFTHYDVTATHVTSYNNPDLSLIDTVTIHEMIHSIGVPASGSSQIGWLVNDEDDNEDLPDRLYVSDGRVETLYAAQQPNISKQDERTYILTLTPSMAGWNYGWCLDPTRGLQTLQSITRLSDNAAIDMRNVWQTPCVMRDQADPVHEHRLHVADSIGVETSYRLVFSEPLNVVVSDAKDASALSLSSRAELTVTPTGHLTVDQPAAVHSLTMQYSESGHAQVTGITDLTAATVEMTLQLPTPNGGVAGHWFAFAVPFEVNIERGIRVEGANAPARYGYDYIIEEYDGALRAATQDGWRRLSASANLLPGRLYMLYTAGETAWRLTAAHPAALTEAHSVDVQAYVSSLNNRHSGWNGIANTLWSNAAAALDGVGYATTYNNMFSVYQAVRTAEYAFIPAEPFFVQTPAAGSVLFADDAAPAPWRVGAAEIPTMTVALTNEAQTFTDKAYISMAQDKPNTYMIGHDLEKMQVAAPAVPQLWLEAYNMHLAAYETTFVGDGQIIPLGMFAPAEGYYTIVLDNAPADKSITLLRNDQPVWNLSESACVASLHAGNNADYALRISHKRDVITDLNTLNSGNAEVRKLIIDDQLYILRGDKTYTVQGQEVK